MAAVIDQLQKKFNLAIEAPFSVVIEERLHVFECHIQGYGATRGMVIDQDWKKLSPVKTALVQMGFGYSCFNIENAEIEEFQEVLNDWGSINA